MGLANIITVPSTAREPLRVDGGCTVLSREDIST
jgi:hypothetical protein